MSNNYGNMSLRDRSYLEEKAVSQVICELHKLNLPISVPWRTC